VIEGLISQPPDFVNGGAWVIMQRWYCERKDHSLARIETIVRFAPTLVVIGMALAGSSAAAHGDEHRDAAYGKPGDRA
jgi:hypothetical protein